MKNALLILLTLGIYSFWGRTEVRKHIWSSVNINGEQVEYTGTGGELFKGFLIAVIVVILPLYALNYASQILLLSAPVLGGSLLFLAFIAAMFFIGAGVYFARRYRASRTVWRGIRGAQTGSAWSYAWKYVLSMIALFLSLGWSYPALKTKLTSILTRETSFGTLPFKFEGSSRPLYKVFAISWFLSFVLFVATSFSITWSTIGLGLATEVEEALFGLGTFAFLFIGLPLALSIYNVQQLNLHTSYTGFQGLTFSLNAKIGSVFWLVVSNMLLIVCTLGIARPIAQQRIVRYFIDRLTVSGATDIEAIAQAQQERGTTGEGLAGVFDIDGF